MAMAEIVGEELKAISPNNFDSTLVLQLMRFNQELVNVVSPLRPDTSPEADITIFRKNGFAITLARENNVIAFEYPPPPKALPASHIIEIP